MPEDPSLNKWPRALQWVLENPVGSLLAFAVLFGALFLLLTRSAERTGGVRRFIISTMKVAAFYATFLCVASLLVGLPLVAAMYIGRYFGREETALTAAAVAGPFVAIPVFYYAFKITEFLTTATAVIWQKNIGRGSKSDA